MFVYLKYSENYETVALSRILRGCHQHIFYTLMGVNVIYFSTAKVDEINKRIKPLNPREATGPDGIPVKILKIARNVIVSHLTNIINRDIKEDKFSEDAKTAFVRSLYKKIDRDKIQNYRPVSILNGFSKVYERYLLNSLSNHIKKINSNSLQHTEKRTAQVMLTD